MLAPWVEITRVGALGALSRRFSDTHVRPNTTYSYRLAAVRPDGTEVLSTVTTARTAPAALALQQNAPNPFNAGTNITFTLEARAPVKLDVYDIAGRRVRRLVNKPLEAGTRRAYWNGLNEHGVRVASGVYLVRLKAGSRVLTRRMVVLR